MASFFRGFKTALKYIKQNILAIVLFNVFYTVTAFVVMNLFSHHGFNLSLQLAGVKYIGRSTYASYLASPFSWIYILLTILLTAFFIMVQIAGVIYVFDASKHGKKAKLFETLHFAVGSAFSTVKPKNFGMILLLVFILPFMGLAGLSNMSGSIVIPGFIMDFIKRIPLLYIALIAVVLLMLVYVISNAFVFHTFVIDKSRFKLARKKSRALLKGNHIKTVLFIIIFNIALVLIFAVIGFVIALILAGIDVGIESIKFTDALYITVFAVICGVAYISPIFEIACISSLYYKFCEQKSEQSKAIEQKSSKKSIAVVYSVVAVVCAGLCVCSFVTMQNSTILKRPSIVAHRGDSVRAPENTMPAFKLAMDEGVCEWIELDVHQTKDGVIVVSHDDSMALVADTTKCVHEMTYDELEQLDVGIRFSEEYKGTRISTLEEVIEACKGRIKLLIEIKPTEFDQRLPESVVDIIRKMNFENDCMVTSLSPEPLKTVREYDPTITTAFNMVLASGEISKIPFSDHPIIEEQSVTEDIVNDMHSNNRSVFAWTINSPDSVQHMVDLQVDAILTDDPIMLNDALNKASYVGGLPLLLREIIYSEFG